MSIETAVNEAETTSAPLTDEAPEVLVEDLLVEEVSIDGMCGVY
jgi:mycofactocin precursor